METLLHVVNSLAPVFLIVALGAGLRRWRFLSDDVLRGMNRLAYWVGLPCLLFSKLAGTTYAGGAAGWLFLLVLIGMAGCIVVGLAVAMVLRMPAGQIGAFVHTAFRGNLAYVGLPVVVYAFASAGGDAGARSAETTAILALGPIVPVYNVVAIAVLLIGRGRFTLRSVGRMLFEVATNPLLLACAAGVAFSTTGWPMPRAVGRTIATAGQFALPLALLCVGGALAGARLRRRAAYSLVAAVIKVAVGPAVGYAAARMLVSVVSLAIAVALI